MKYLWLLLISATARGAPVYYSIAIGHNAAPASEAALGTLRYADDDAVRYDALFATITKKHWLLARLDSQTERKYPSVSAQARPPTLAILSETVQSLRDAMRADISRGDAPILYLTFSGHGAQNAEGEFFLNLADGGLTQRLLYETILAELPASLVHMFVDACHAEAVVGSRGLFEREREGTVVQAEAALKQFVARSGLRHFPHVGAMIATTANQEAHEWAQFQSGVFTHEVLSGLSGAADVNGDGNIEYSELEAFVVAANREVKDPRALPRVLSYPPSTDPHAAIVRVAPRTHLTYLVDTFKTLGHFYIELDNGERYLDAHFSGEERLSIALPANRRLFVVAGQQEAVFEGKPGRTYSVADLAFKPVTLGVRGSIDSSLRTALFAAPFGATYYKGFADSAGISGVIFIPRDEVAAPWPWRKSASVVALSLAGASLIAAGVMTGKAVDARNRYEATSLQRPAAAARDEYALFGNGALVCASGTTLFALAGWLLWPPSDDATPQVALSASAAGVAVSLAGQF